MARTGVSVASFLVEQKAQVCCTDMKPAEAFDDSVHSLESRGCVLRLGEHRKEDFLGADLVVVSPGVPLSIPPIQAAVKAGTEVIGDVELISRFIRVPVVGITGTNGKTTTTSLIHHLLKESGIPHSVGGNIGEPMAGFLLEDAVNRDEEPPKLFLAELSSFQLEGIVHFRPWISVWTNLSEDHLDRYPDMASYAEAKSRIFMNQTGQDIAVIPDRDPWLDEFQGRIQARLLRFGAPGEPMPQVCFTEGRIHMRLDKEGDEEIYATDRIRIRGHHNLENMMVALAVARLCGARADSLQAAMETFNGLEHRLEFTAERDGISFYNDSKATTVTSVVRALDSFARPVILLAGGKDKGGSYAPLIGSLNQHVRKLFLFGEAAARMEEELATATCEIRRVSDMEEAVEQAWREADLGEAVLLSPACSSFDQYTDYEDRGRHFKRIVGKVTGETPNGPGGSS